MLKLLPVLVFLTPAEVLSGLQILLVGNDLWHIMQADFVILPFLSVLVPT